MADTIDDRSDGKKRKRRKRVTVAVEALPESEDKLAPLIGYFPSGYDPTASAGSGDGAVADPSVRIYRNMKKTSRLELVVHPGGSSGVSFVGTNYSGEATAPQVCSYALGVFDKESKTLKIAPIAANKIFRMEPRFLKNRHVEAEPSESVAEDGVKVERKITDLTSLYGTKRDRDNDKKRQSLNEQRTDPTTDELMESHDNDSDMETEVHEDTSAPAVRNIPPHDLSAETPDKAYSLDEIIPKGEKIYHLEILESLQSGEDFSANGYPRFVSNRIDKLKAIQVEEEQEKLACILSYITHLVTFWVRYSSRHGKSTAVHPKIPRVIYQKLLAMFLDEESNRLSAEKNELLIEYILVLTLFADDFRTEPSDIAKDLKMTVQSLRPYYQQLGCKGNKETPFAPYYMTLPVPLKFPEMRRNRRRR